MPSESVWFEQVDSALISFIKSKINMYNNEGVLYSIPVSVRKPDEDFKIEQYPSITIYNTSSRFADERYDREAKIAYRSGNGKVQLEDLALPYDLFYQIDFWSRTQTEMNEMTRLWLGKVPKYFNLAVKDMSGIIRDCFVLQRSDLVKDDYLQGYDRTFHSTITYRISVELDEKLVTELPMVTEPLIINSKIGG